MSSQAESAFCVIWWKGCTVCFGIRVHRVALILAVCELRARTLSGEEVYIMAHGRTSEGRTSNRGFASMDQERQRQIASMGGKAVPDSKRSFSQNRELAAQAGRKGGQSVPGEKRSFSQNR